MRLAVADERAGQVSNLPLRVTVFCLRWAEISDGLMRRAVVDELGGRFESQGRFAGQV